MGIIKLLKTPTAESLLGIPVRLRRRPHLKREADKLREDEKNLRHFEKCVYSQNGEDGIIQEIFSRIGTTNQIFVEIGIETGEECNTRNLLEEHQWQGVWVEGSEEKAITAKKKFEHLPIRIISEMVDRDNISELWNSLELPSDIDLLSIDIDGNDYWVWESVSARPRLVVIEYNASYGADKDWIMPYNANHRWKGDNYMGASLLALEKLGHRKGYSLVGCDSNGVNAFFILNKVLEEHVKSFTHIDGGAHYHYSSPKFSRYFFGHAPHLLARLRKYL